MSTYNYYNLDNSTLYFFETTLLKFIETCYFKDWLIENNLNFEKTEEYMKLIKEFLTTIKTLDFDKNNLHESIYKNLTNKFLDFIIEKQNLKKPFFIDPLVLFAIVFVISIKLNQ